MTGDAEIFCFIIFFTLFNSGTCVSDQVQFYGADENKIQESPKYLKICHRSDEKIDNCIKSSLRKFMESVNSGSPELNLPSIDPIEIPLVEFQQGSGNVSLHVTFKNFLILGFKNFKIMSVKSNLIDNKMEISIDNPSVTLTAKFSAEGGVFTFPIAARGDFSLNLTDVSVLLILRLTTARVARGLSFFTVDECLVDLLPNDVTAHFGDVIDGSNKIGAAFNFFVNRNAQEIFSVIKPKLSKILADVFGAIANEILNKHPDDVLLPP